MKYFHARLHEGCACLFVALFLLCAAPVQAQTIAPKNSPQQYASWVNARKPATTPKDAWDSIPTGKSAALPPYYDVFWRALLHTESDGTHFRSSLPKPGGSDFKRYGNNIISIGISQARYIDGQPGALRYSSPPAAFQEAKPHSPYIQNQSWDLSRYLWDPAYNAAIGYGYYSKAMKGAAGNNPCLAYAYYNGGPGGMRDYVSAKFKSPLAIVTHMSKFVSKAKLHAGANRNEIEHILRTSPGCGENMDDVVPMPPVAVAVRGEIHVPGYCHPDAAKILQGRYEQMQKDRDETFEPLLRKINDRPTATTAQAPVPGSPGSGYPTSGPSSGGVVSDSINQLSSCISLSWPKPTFTAPTMDELLRGAQQEVVNRACQAAREKIADARSKWNGQFYFNTRLPGVPPVGLSTTGSTPDAP